MGRFAFFLLLFVAAACAFDNTATEPAQDPTLAVFHGRTLVTHSGPRSDSELRVACGSGIVRRGEVFAVDHGFPAPFAAAIAGDFQPQAMQVIVFGGTFADTGPGTQIRSSLISGRHVEIATLVLGDEEAQPLLDFSVIPMSLMGGAGTVTIEAAAVDADGRELRTGYPLVGTATALCGVS
ncbi:MAG: hypothetical protein AAF608_04615 [Pseudomonadota bacterium]